MTICVAAIGKIDQKSQKEALVLATDHMISLSDKEFELDIEKYRNINDNVVAMYSGETLLFESLLWNLETNDNLFGMVEKVKSNMLNVRNQRLQERILNKFNLSIDHLHELLKEPEHNDTTHQIAQAAGALSLNSMVLLCGFQDGKAHIVEVSDQHSQNCRDIGFSAIGSGGEQAVHALLFQKHSRNESLSTTLYNVFKAKKNSEVAKGVGKETDLFILHDGNIRHIGKEHKEGLQKIYEEEMYLGKNHKSLQNILQNIPI